jgi:hypothetical protein
MAELAALEGRRPAGRYEPAGLEEWNEEPPSKGGNVGSVPPSIRGSILIPSKKVRPAIDRKNPAVEISRG